MVGYDPHNWKCYRVLDINKLVVKRTVHVTFDEHGFPGKLKIDDLSASEDDDFIVLTETRKEEATKSSEAVQDVNIREAINLLPRNTTLLPIVVSNQDVPPVQDGQAPRERVQMV